MKIGIVTIVDNTNFGNRLQNYAVYFILSKRYGCKVRTLATKQENRFGDGNYVLWCKEKFAKFLATTVPSVAEKNFGNNISRWANFCNWSKHIPTTCYFGNDRLPDKINEKYDLFFAGSDQIWNYHFSFRKFYNYFLKFADDKKKIAISASFGVESIPAEWRKEYIEGLNGFSHISVREEAGQAIVKDLIGENVPVLIDPVMMLSKEEWMNVSKKPRIDCSKPYVLKYYLGDKSESAKIDLWAKEKGYEVYELLDAHIPELYSAGPGEFITLIRNAALVCSDSFHCIVMAIIFSRPFVVYARKGKDANMSSRLETLLKKFGFQDRWESFLDESQYLNCKYDRVEELLRKEQQKFSDYISDVLGGK